MHHCFCNTPDRSVVRCPSVERAVSTEVWLSWQITTGVLSLLGTRGTSSFLFQAILEDDAIDKSATIQNKQLLHHPCQRLHQHVSTCFDICCLLSLVLNLEILRGLIRGHYWTRHEKQIKSFIPINSIVGLLRFLLFDPHEKYSF